MFFLLSFSILAVCKIIMLRSKVGYLAGFCVCSKPHSKRFECGETP